MSDTKTSIIISAEDRTRAAFASATNGLRELEAAAARIPVVMGAVAGGTALAALAATMREAISFTAALDDMAEKTGASVESLSGLARVAQIGGHDLGMVEQAAIKLGKALAEADNKSSGAHRALKALGLSAADLRGMDTGDALKVVADRLNEFKDGAGKSALAMDLLGKSGAQALPFLKDLAEQGELLKTVTSEQAAAAEKFEKNIGKLKASFNDLARSVANQVVPALNEFLGMMDKGGALGALSASLDRTLVGGDISARIRELQDELAAREKSRKEPGSMTGGGLMGALAGYSDEGLRRRIAALKELYAAEVLANNSASYSNEGRQRAAGSLAGYTSAPEDKGPRGKTDLQRMEELGQKNLMDAYYATAGEETMREVADKRAMDSARARAKAIEDLANAEQRLIDMTTSGKLAKFYEQSDLAAGMLQSGKIDFEQYDEIINKLAGVQDKAKETRSVFDDLAAAIDGWGKQTSAAIAEMVVSSKGNLSDLGEAFAKEMLQMAIYKTVMQPLTKSLSGMFPGTGYGDTAGAAAGVPHYAQGTNYVPNDGLAYLHRGEAVVPAKYNGGGSGSNVTIINNSGLPATQREVKDDRGGRKIEVQIGEAAAAQILTPGSPLARAARARTLVRRG